MTLADLQADITECDLLIVTKNLAGGRCVMIGGEWLHRWLPEAGLPFGGLGN